MTSNTQLPPAVAGPVERQLGPTLELLNRVLPCNPPWGPGQYVNVERVGLLLAAERERCAAWLERVAHQPGADDWPQSDAAVAVLTMAALMLLDGPNDADKRRDAAGGASA